MSAAAEIQTVTGPTTPDALGVTLMHEHVMIGYPGWEADSIRPGPSRDEMFARCVDRIEEMKGQGITAMLDPCPNDLGRDVEFMAKLAQKTGF
ncbi:MAG: phosphotriesterase family protein, partial [Myxococcota bacterium]